MLYIRNETRLIEWMFDRFESGFGWNNMPKKLMESWDHIRETVARGTLPDWDWEDLDLDDLKSRELAYFLDDVRTIDEVSPEQAQACTILFGIQRLNLQKEMRLKAEGNVVFIFGFVRFEDRDIATVIAPLRAMNQHASE